MYILSQVLVGLSDLFCIFSMLSKKKEHIVVFLLIATILFASHFMCLGGWTGAAVSLVELVFLILMYIFEKKDKTQFGKYLSLATIIVSVAVSLLTWAGPISLLPMFAMVIYFATMMFSNIIIVKTGTFVRFILNGVYMLLITSYLGAGLTLVIMAFAIAGIVRDVKNRQKVGQSEESL